MKPAKHQYTILKQICQYIPAHLVSTLARSNGDTMPVCILKAFILFVLSYISNFALNSCSCSHLRAH